MTYTFELLCLCGWPFWLAAWVLPFLLGIWYGFQRSKKYIEANKTLETSYINLQNQNKTLNDELAAQQRHIRTTKNEINLFNSKFKERDQRIKFLDDRILSLKSKNEKLKMELDGLKSNIKDSSKAKSTSKKVEDLASDKKNDEGKNDVKKDSDTTKTIPKSTSIKTLSEATPITYTQPNIPPSLENKALQVQSALSDASNTKIEPVLKKIEQKKQKKEAKKLEKKLKKEGKVADVSSQSVEKTKKRGRPVGSKNKKTISRGRPIDDLKKIEGIGPKMEQALRKAGYKTFLKISKTTPQVLKSTLMEQSNRFKMANTDTWPQQALLAHKGKWDELKALQDTLNGGNNK